MTRLPSSDTYVAPAASATQNTAMGKRGTLNGTADLMAQARRIHRAIECAGLTFTEVAARIGVTRSAVSQWAKGQTNVGPRNMVLLADITNRRIQWLMTGRGPEEADADIRSEDIVASLTPGHDDKGIPVVGYVGAAGQFGYYNLSQGELDQIPRRPGDPQDAVAAEIKGTSLGPALTGWYAIYDKNPGPVTSDMIGQLCVVWLPDDRVLVKQIKRNRRDPQRFDLYSNNPADPPLEAVKIDRAAVVENLRRPGGTVKP